MSDFLANAWCMLAWTFESIPRPRRPRRPRVTGEALVMLLGLALCLLLGWLISQGAQ